MEAVQDGTSNLTGEGIRFIYDDSGTRVMKIDGPDKMAAYVNQFYVVQNPQDGGNSLATKEIFIGNNRIAAQMVNGSTTTTTTSTSSSNSSPVAQWIGSWGVSIANGNTDAVSFGSMNNFVTVNADGTQVLAQPGIWTKGMHVNGAPIL